VTSGTTESLAAVVFGNNQFVAVGTRGVVLTSPTGVTWTVQAPPVAVELNGLTFADNQFVAAGSNGTLLTSPDGITWTARTTNVASNLNAIVKSSNLYVAVGDASSIITSPDAITWTVRSTGVANRNFRSVAFLNGIFAAGYGGRFVNTNPGGVSFSTASNNVFTSPDGISWTQQFSTTSSGIAASASQFLAAGFNTLVTSP